MIEAIAVFGTLFVLMAAVAGYSLRQWNKAERALVVACSRVMVLEEDRARALQELLAERLRSQSAPLSQPRGAEPPLFRLSALNGSTKRSPGGSGE